MLIKEWQKYYFVCPVVLEKKIKNIKKRHETTMEGMGVRGKPLVSWETWYKKRNNHYSERDARSVV